jgi:acetolactate synthase-1/2/3 large subunit
MKTRGADALVQSLQACGVRRVFTLSGNHIMPVYDAAFDAGIELLHVRHEAAAVHMADAWARLTGETGVALVTGGPGHANAVAALYTAGMAESPVVLLSGHAPNSQAKMGAFQEMRQAEIAAPLAKASWTCAAAAAVAGDVEKAVAIAREGRAGPVHLSLPVDVMEGETGAEATRRRPIVAAQQGLDAQSFLARLRRAKRPLILTGPASTTKSGRERMGLLGQASGIPVVAMESPRGIADPCLGAFAQVLAQADCILLLGKRLDFTLRFAKAPAIAAKCAFLQVDAEEEEIERTRRAVGARLGQTAIATFVEASEALLLEAGKLAPVRSAWLDEVRQAIAYRPAAWAGARSGEAGCMHPVQALRPLQALLDSHPDSVFVADGGEFGQWAQACLAAPNRVINGVAGAIGAALPFALAARLARPDAPVIAVMGDGTFGFHPAEIDTAVRYGLPFVAVVGNDARWNAEYQIQIREYGAGRAIGTQLLPTRYDEVAKGFGGHGELVTEASKMQAALRRANDSGLPAVLNVLIEGLAAPVVSIPTN